MAWADAVVLIGKEPRFLEVVDQVYAILAGQTQLEHVELGSAPGEPGLPRGLPDVSINELAGLMEHALYMHTVAGMIFFGRQRT